LLPETNFEQRFFRPIPANGKKLRILKRSERSRDHAFLAAHIHRGADVPWRVIVADADPVSGCQRTHCQSDTALNVWRRRATLASISSWVSTPLSINSRAMAAVQRS